VHVEYLLSRGTALDVGGFFDTAGGVGSKNVASWSGTSWQGYGAGLNTTVHSLIAYQNLLYAGGAFRFPVGGVIDSTRHVAVWEGALGWRPLVDTATGENGVYIGVDGSGVVRAMTVWNGKLVVGGSFDRTAASTTTVARNIAAWERNDATGIHSWTTLGEGLGTGSSTVYALANIGGVLYAGGNFTTSGSSTRRYLAYWDEATSTWLSPTTGFPAGANEVRTILADGQGGLLVGGTFQVTSLADASLYTVNNLAVFRDGRWRGVSGGLGSAPTGDAVFACVTRGDSLFVGGDFLTAGYPLLSGTYIPSHRIALFAQDMSALGARPVGLPPRSETVVLFSPRPNPSRDGASIVFALSEPSHVGLDILDVAGRRVARLVDGEHTSGLHSVTWDGTTENGARATGGIYLVRLSTPRTVASQKIVLSR
jgi:hypothetical protein